MAGFTSIPLPKPGKPSRAPITKPAGSGNPILGRYSQFFAPKQVQSGPVRNVGAPVTAPSPGLTQAPGAGQAPGAAGQAPGTSGTQTSQSSSGGPPLDATAINNIATNQFKAGNSINSLNQQASDIGTNLQAALANLAYQQPRDALKLEQGANRRGALYSSAYNQDLGDQTHAYATKQTGLTTTAGQQTGRIDDAIAAILGGIPFYNQGQANDSTGRAIAAAAANPATGQPPSLTPEQVKYINAGMAPPSGAGSAPTPPATRSNPIPQAPHGHPAHAANPFFSQGYVDSKGKWVSTVKNPPSSGSFRSTVRRVR